ncbi:MAG: hypothetical protein E7511_03010 [Ruminococcus sp.]|nr:hypothetical protein [Ruminococcus sp.]
MTTIRFDIPKKMRFDLNKGNGGSGAPQGTTLPHPAAASAASRIAPIPDALSGIMTRTEEAT